ncbi:MAG: hypothetical protein KAS62_01675 [Candidatus Delongbacteria bacterium]|nr:hypothetical protein [Candidatus Delongbacteria bacterium]
MFKSLESDWELTREFLNLETNTKDFATGNALFTKLNKIDQNLLSYEESGTLTLTDNSTKINFNRKYIYELKDNKINIILNDGINKGQLFQTLIPTDNGCSFVGTEHICINDKYNGKYIFINKNEFSIEIIKKGPRSNLRIMTRFNRRNRKKD